MSVTDVARLMGVTKQAASKLVSSMIRAGYLRDVEAGDGRVRHVAVSQRGRKLLEAVETIYGELEREWTKVLGTTGVSRLRANLVKVLVARHGELPRVRPPVTA